jgi:hypothetical protein
VKLWQLVTNETLDSVIIGLLEFGGNIFGELLGDLLGGILNGLSIGDF